MRTKEELREYNRLYKQSEKYRAYEVSRAEHNRTRSRLRRRRILAHKGAIPVWRRIAESAIKAEYESELKAFRKLEWTKTDFGRLFWNVRSEARKQRDRRRAQWRRKHCPRYRSMFVSRKRIRQFMRSKQWHRTSTIRSMIKCTPQQLREHLQSQFRDGMKWNNHGTVWEVDHHIPLASAKSADDVPALAHYSNLKPLLKHENRAKRDHIPMSSGPSQK